MHCSGPGRPPPLPDGGCGLALGGPHAPTRWRGRARCQRLATQSTAPKTSETCCCGCGDCGSSETETRRQPADVGEGGAEAGRPGADRQGARDRITPAPRPPPKSSQEMPSHGTPSVCVGQAQRVRMCVRMCVHVTVPLHVVLSLKGCLHARRGRPQQGSSGMAVHRGRRGRVPPLPPPLPSLQTKVMTSVHKPYLRRRSPRFRCRSVMGQRHPFANGPHSRTTWGGGGVLRLRPGGLGRGQCPPLPHPGPLTLTPARTRRRAPAPLCVRPHVCARAPAHEWPLGPSCGSSPPPPPPTARRLPPPPGGTCDRDPQ